MSLARTAGMDPREHQRDSGEKEHFNREQQPQQPQQSSSDSSEAEHAREKANKNNTHRSEQTGHAEAEAQRVRKEAERAG